METASPPPSSSSASSSSSPVSNKAHGQQLGTPFLHATTSLAKAKDIYQERRDRYPGGVVVRFPRSAVMCLDVGKQTKENEPVFGDQVEDQHDRGIQADLDQLRIYGVKDQEVVCLSNPPRDKVDFWHNVHGCWFPISRWRGSKVVSY